MFTVNEIRKEMARLDQISGLDTSKIPIRVSSRMSKQWGHCTATRPCGGRFTIKELAFSDRLLKYATPEHVLDTVRHEYAHAYVFLAHQKNDGHGRIWKSAAVKFGAPPSRCNDKPEVYEHILEHENKSRYEISCPKCDWKCRYTRAGNAVKALRADPKCMRFYCPVCGSRPLKLTER